ncbi:MAG: OB-fold domain-containing protein [Burkholderiaceae bacterium]
MTEQIGITGYGCYLPRYRLAREEIARANSWFNSALNGLGRGERTVASWDEDATTMAVEAARSIVRRDPGGGIGLVCMASTTHPFADRQNAGVLAGALDLHDAETLDAGGSLRAGTTALRLAFDTARSRSMSVLVSAADKRKSQVASVQEMRYGDGAAAVRVGPGRVLARLRGSATMARDFNAQFRAADHEFDYAWEERWIRDEGLLKLLPEVIGKALACAGVRPAEVAHFCVPTMLPRVPVGVAKRVGVAESAVRDPLLSVVGDTGAAHPLLMLAQALDQARAGDLIVVAAFGSGADVLVFEATDALPAWRDEYLGAAGAVGTMLARSKALGVYQKMLAFNDTIALDHGMRAEVDKGSPMTLLNRKQEMTLGLHGGRCRACGTLQFPRNRYCVNPQCNALDSQDEHRFAETPAAIMSYTADQLTYSPNPPAYYGMIVFDGGGRMMADITDIETDQIAVGLPVEMSFRIKDIDKRRGFVKYFWKAVPRT